MSQPLAGAVRLVVRQIAKIRGTRSTAGGADKGAFLKQIGVDHVIDYKATGNLTEALLQASPQRVDVYFYNVGGEHLEAALTAANPVRPLHALRDDLAIQCGTPAGPRISCSAVGKDRSRASLSNHFKVSSPEFQKTCQGGYEGQADVEGDRRAWHRDAPTAFKIVQGLIGKMLVKLG